jgi:alkylation response protein AidB-like acyl-CoA dehydrogenase
MRFALSPEQREFAASLDDLLSSADLPAVVRRWADGDVEPGRDLWRRLGDLGATGLAVGEEFGGMAAHPVDLVVAFVQFGRHVVPGPLVESLAVVPTLLSGTEVGARWLPGLADGKTVASVAFPPHAPYALDAGVADVVFTVDGDTVRRATPGEPVSSVDIARRLYQVEAGDLVVSEADSARAFDLGVLCCAAQVLGAGRALLATSTEYVTQLLYGAALSFADGASTVSRDISAAKIAATGAAYRAARTALQVHGAIGYTREYDLGLWLTKVRALKSAWGTEAFHRARVMAALADSTPEAG